MGVRRERDVVMRVEKKDDKYFIVTSFPEKDGVVWGKISPFFDTETEATKWMQEAEKKSNSIRYKDKSIVESELEGMRFFWKTPSPFSNWTRSKFSMTFKGRRYNFNCAEQAMMFGKALLFSDAETGRKILKANAPWKQKALGREVKGFKEDAWEAHKQDLMVAILLHKFGQNEGMQKHLLETGDLVLVEASPTDDIWGIKLEAYEPQAWSKDTWKGSNLLGEALMETRKILRGAS